MRRVQNSDSETILYRDGGIAQLLPAMLFLAMASGLVALVLVDRNGERAPLIPAAILGVAGFLLLTWRRGFLLHVRERTYESWWGFLVRWRTETGTVDDFRGVGVFHELRRSKNHTYHVYPVKLLRGNNGKPIQLEAPRKYEAARHSATGLAQATGLPLTDASQGVEIVREAAHLGESLRERASRLGTQASPFAPPPAGIRSRFAMEGRSIRFELPAPGYSLRSLAPVIPVLIFEVFLFAAFLLNAIEDGDLEAWLEPPQVYFLALFVLVLTIPLGLVALHLIRAARKIWTVEASPERLRLVETAPFLHRVVELPSDEIQELVVGGGEKRARAKQKPSVIILSKDRTITFGEHLGDEEKRWIRDVLEQVLVS